MHRLIERDNEENLRQVFSAIYFFIIVPSLPGKLSPVPPLAASSQQPALPWRPGPTPHRLAESWLPLKDKKISVIEPFVLIAGPHHYELVLAKWSLD
jgi:hypothetical protein